MRIVIISNVVDKGGCSNVTSKRPCKNQAELLRKLANDPTSWLILMFLINVLKHLAQIFEYHIK